MHTPPLVTTAPLPAGSPPAAVPAGSNLGYVGTAGTQILFGKDGEFLGLQDETTHFRMWSDGNPLLSRPFLDVSKTTPIENVEKVAYPRGNLGSLDGSVSVDAQTHFMSSGARLLFTTCFEEACWNDACWTGQTFHDSCRRQFLVGYRHLELNDQLGVTEELTSTNARTADDNGNPLPGLSAFVVKDQFNTKNQFNGAEIGWVFELRRNRWSLDLTPKVALGETHETVTVSGSTRNTDPTGAQTTVQGGLLAQPSRNFTAANNVAVSYPGNIGTFNKDVFSAVPEFDLTLGYQLTRHLRLDCGYTVMYWSRVARAGDQIDYSVNPYLLPNVPAAQLAQATGNFTHPGVPLVQTGFWAQGVNFGVECRW